MVLVAAPYEEVRDACSLVKAYYGAQNLALEFRWEEEYIFIGIDIVE